MSDNTNNPEKEKNFSFIKLREEIITKSGGINPNIFHTPGFKEPTKKLRFEPNINITRSHTHENPEQFNTFKKDNITQNSNIGINNISFNSDNQDGTIGGEVVQQSNTVNSSESKIYLKFYKFFIIIFL
jgi:hypothetical protein